MSQNSIEKINELTEKIALEPENAELYSDRGDCYWEDKDYDKAIKDFTRAIELKPENARGFFYSIGEVYLERFDCYWESKDYDKAIKDYTRAIELKPKVRSSFVFMVWAKDKDKAVEFYTKAIELQPENAEFYSDRALCYRYNEEYGKAIEDYTKAIELQPENAEFYSKRADFYRYSSYRDRREKAEKDYTKAIELQPENAEFYSKRADFYLYFSYQYREEKAEQDYTKAIELQPEKAEFYSKRGKCYSKMENYDKALKDCDKAIELDPKRAEAYSDRGRCYFEMKNYDEALKNCDKAVELDPKCAEAYLVYGKYYFERENYDEALKNFDKAIELDPNCAEAYENRGDIYNKIKDSNLEAQDDYEQACKLAPNNEKIFDKLYNFYIEWGNFEDAADLSNDIWQSDIYVLFNDISAARDRELNDIFADQDRAIAQARLDERNKVIADLSHSIKNLISTIIDPLNNLKKEKEVKPAVIDDALKGANLIRQVVNAMNLSFKGSVEDFYYDARNTDKDRTDLHSAFAESLISSVGNMFDGKYFPDFQIEYFCSEDTLNEAESEWTEISQSKDLQKITAFLGKYFFDCDFSFDKAGDYAIGNEKGSAVKLLILFQELILNAVKYSAFVRRENRRLRISFDDSPEQIAVRIENRYNDRINVSTSGIGHVIVENFCKLMETEPAVSKENGIYAVEIRFSNFWKETDK